MVGADKYCSTINLKSGVLTCDLPDVQPMSLKGDSLPRIIVSYSFVYLSCIHEYNALQEFNFFENQFHAELQKNVKISRQNRIGLLSFNFRQYKIGK